MQNKTRTQEISALGHFLIQNSSGPVSETCFYHTFKYNMLLGKWIQLTLLSNITHYGS